MSDNKKREFNERMLLLNEKYLQQLPGKYKEIEDSWNNYQTDLSNADHLELFYRLIHTLKGTAGTFGFSKQSDCCFEIQKLLIDKKENPALSEDIFRKIKIQLNELKANISAPAKDISE